MLRLILFRHAKAGHHTDLTDHERPLTTLGHTQARQMGEYIGAHKLDPDLVIVSSARRTQESWSHASDAGKIVATSVTEPRIYESSLDNLLQVIKQQDAQHRCIMLVGHNPGLEQLTTWLTGCSTEKALQQLQQGFVPGGLAVIDVPTGSWAALESHSGQLTRFETPQTI